MRMDTWEQKQRKHRAGKYDKMAANERCLAQWVYVRKSLLFIPCTYTDPDTEIHTAMSTFLCSSTV